MEFDSFSIARGSMAQLSANGDSEAILLN